MYGKKVTKNAKQTVKSSQKQTAISHQIRIFNFFHGQCWCATRWQVPVWCALTAASPVEYQHRRGLHLAAALLHVILSVQSAPSTDSDTRADMQRGLTCSQTTDNQILSLHC